MTSTRHPYVFMNFVSTLDGRAALDGSTRPLGGPVTELELGAVRRPVAGVERVERGVGRQRVALVGDRCVQPVGKPLRPAGVRDVRFSGGEGLGIMRRVTRPWPVVQRFVVSQ